MDPLLRHSVPMHHHPAALRAQDAVADVLRRRIMLGGFDPGDKLPTERELAAVLEVSRNTVREAVRLLQAEGIVSTSRGRSGGTRVTAGTELSAEARERLAGDFSARLAAHMEYRFLLEPAAAALAAARATPADVTRITAALTEPAADLTAYHRADTALHLAIAQASHNTVLADAIAAARAHMFADTNVLWLHTDWQRIYGVDMSLAEAMQHDHAPIVQAIAAHDEDRARRAMLNHLEESLNQFTTVLAILRHNN